MTERTRHVHRRTVLGAVGVSVVGLGSVAAPATARGRGRRRGRESVAFTRLGANTVDADGDGVDVSVERTRKAGRRPVAHVTSHGEPTGDYATSVVNVGRVPLGDVDELTYDYYGGEDNDVSAPDEVWLLVEAGDGAHSVYRASNDGEPAAGEWRTRDVHREIVGAPEHNPGYHWYEVTPAGRTQLAESLVEEFGEDAAIRRVGAGRGSFGGGDTLDIYYDNLVVNGAGRGQFPHR